MRILWFSHFVPYPPKGGVFQRGYNLLTQIGVGHEIHLLALRHKQGTHPPEELARAQEALLACCAEVKIVDISAATRPAAMLRRAAGSLLTGEPLTVSIFRSEAVRAALRAQIAATPFDVVHLDTISLAQYLDDIGPIPAVLTHLGPESFMIRRRMRFESSLPKRTFFAAEWRMLERYERRMCRAVASNIVMSEFDQAIMADIAPAARFAVVPNGVDVAYFQPGPIPDTRTLVFAGRLDQYATRDAILDFLRRTWPLVRADHPDAVLTILGLNPPEALQRAAVQDPSVRLLGFVPDVRPYFREASISVCPIRDGGGTRLKVLDAMAMGMPIVSTTVGCEGIDLTPEEHLLIADTPAAFARQIDRLFRDRALRERLGRSARVRAEEQYAWPRLADALVAEYAVAAGRRLDRTSGAVTEA